MSSMEFQKVKGSVGSSGGNDEDCNAEEPLSELRILCVGSLPVASSSGNEDAPSPPPKENNIDYEEPASLLKIICTKSLAIAATSVDDKTENGICDDDGDEDALSVTVEEVVDLDSSPSSPTPAMATSSSTSKTARKRSAFSCDTCGEASARFHAASSIAMVYYGHATDKTDNRYPRLRLCQRCNSDAEKFGRESRQNLVNGRNLFALKMKPTDIPVDLEGGDDNNNAHSHPNRSKRKTDDLIEFSERELSRMVKRFFYKYNVQKQHNECCQVVKKEVKALEGEIKDLDELIDKTRNKFHDIYQLYLPNFQPRKYENRVIRELNIEADGAVTRAPVRRCARMGHSRAPASDIEFLNELITLDREVEVEHIPDSEEVSSPESIATSEENLPLLDLPRNDNQQEFVPRRIYLGIHEGEVAVVAQRQGTSSKCWVQGRYVQDSLSENENDFAIRFGNNPDIVEERPPLTCVAKDFAPIWILPGNYRVRVVARLGRWLVNQHKRARCTCPNRPVNHYLPGTILSARAVKKSRSSRSHYVVAFDNGQISNVRHMDVRVILDGNALDFLDSRRVFYPETNKFIRDFSQSASWKYMVRENCLGDVYSVWHKGKWHLTRVEAVLDEMVNVTFEGKGYLDPEKKCPRPRVSEWIFRGSPRFRRNMEANGLSLETPPVGHQEWTGQFLGFDGIIKKLRVPEIPVSHLARGHTCDRNCTPMEYDSSRHPNDISPLAIPFWFGWTSNDFKELVVTPIRIYTAPCGRRIRRYVEMIQYLQSTQSGLQVDWFTFSTRLDLRHVFKQDCPDNFRKSEQNFNKDMSLAQEKVPIEIINTVDDEALPDFQYFPKYAPADDVEINKVITYCCDCDDGCVDKNRCACWKRTVEGMKDITPGCAGYHERKLQGRIPSGIFECNEKCPCTKEICSNRVVQNGLRWPMQVFKTTTKGWAVRALVDIPKGSFICVYAGRLTTEDVGNEEGVRFGDDYLFDLAFVNEYADKYRKETIQKIKSSTQLSSSASSGDRTPPGVADSDTASDVSTVIVGDGNGEESYDESRGDRGVGDDDNDANILVHPSPLMEQFPPGQPQYTINPKSTGNVGRFFSHSCSPNMFVQDVFVETHDVRFPVIAFFTSDDVYAGMELTWDYSYEVGSVEGKVMTCRCGSNYCSGRIL